MYTVTGTQMYLDINILHSKHSDQSQIKTKTRTTRLVYREAVTVPYINYLNLVISNFKQLC